MEAASSLQPWSVLTLVSAAFAHDALETAKKPAKQAMAAMGGVQARKLAARLDQARKPAARLG